MSLSAGSRLGHYEIVGLLGAGGMGEVYRARDPRLAREVAVKVIALDVSADPDRQRRFEQEARAVAAINHPNILSVHDVGNEAGSPYLVFELLEGESLRQRMVRERLPLRKALDFAVQIARGLAAAHERGIVHRDLKPENVFVTKDGRAKILDFGLAKLVLGDEKVRRGESVTLSAGTNPGTLLGTASYMSPEQVRGEAADARSDIFSFGIVLYEVLAGSRPFRGDTPAEVMTAILREDPKELSGAGTPIPPTLNWIVRRCLEKQPEDRFHSAHDLALALEAVAGSSSAPESLVLAPARARPASSRLVLVAIAALAVGATGAWALRGLGSIRDPSIGQPVTRLQLLFPEGTRFADSHPSVAISRDGTTLVLVARGAKAPELYIRALQGWEWKRLPATEGAASPFFSPDGKWVAFFSAGKLRRVSIAGGTPQVICEAAGGRALLPSGTWGEDGQILFWTWPEPGLWRVSPAGGVPERVKGTEALQLQWYRRPQLLPGGRHVVFGTWSPGSARLEILSLETGQRRTLIAAGSDPSYSSSGHLVFGWDNQILAVPFDVRKLEVRGVPVPLVEGVRMAYGRIVSVDYALSENGTLVYTPGQRPERRLMWADHRGRLEPLPLPKRGYAYPALSPDQDRVAVTIADGPSRHVWIGDLSRGTLSRLTTTDDDAVFSLWTPDAKYVLFTSSAPGQYNLFRKRADGSGEAERLTVSRNPQGANSISPDGKLLLFQENDPISHIDLWQMSLEGERKPVPLLKTAANERFAAFSPDGRWVAYESDESGKFEVYVQPYPGPGQKKQVSTDGGQAATWNSSGRELFYAAADQMMSVSFEVGSPLRIGKPRPLFRLPPLGDFSGKPVYDVSADGQRFLFGEDPEPQSEPRLHVVLNWFDELRRRVPAH